MKLLDICIDFSFVLSIVQKFSSGFEKEREKSDNADINDQLVFES